MHTHHEQSALLLLLRDAPPLVFAGSSSINTEPEPRANTHARARVHAHTQNNRHYQAHLGSRLCHPPNIF